MSKFIPGTDNAFKDVGFPEEESNMLQRKSDLMNFILISCKLKNVRLLKMWNMLLVK